MLSRAGGIKMQARRFPTKRVLASAVLIALLTIGAVHWFWPSPVLKDGDIIFQTSRSGQSRAIMFASRSLYSHMGIVKNSGKGWVVVEATGPVKETPLRQWIHKGWQHRIAVYRYKGLSGSQKNRIFTEAYSLYGRKYDPYFSFTNNSIYCSELVFTAFKAADINLGRIQTIGDLATDMGFVKTLMNRRIKSDPECLSKNMTGEACLKLVRQRKLVTPKAIARDRQLQRVYSNYPF
jgi:hypothetical protein